MPISLDPVDEIPLALAGPSPARVERLFPDGSWRGVDPATPSPGRLDLRLRLLPAEPAILRID